MPKKLQERSAPTPTDAASPRSGAAAPIRPRAERKQAQLAASAAPQVPEPDQTLPVPAPVAAPRSVKSKSPVLNATASAASAKVASSRVASSSRKKSVPQPAVTLLPGEPVAAPEIQTKVLKPRQPAAKKAVPVPVGATSTPRRAARSLPEAVQPEPLQPETAQVSTPPVRAGRKGKAAPNTSEIEAAAQAPVRAAPRNRRQTAVAVEIQPETVQPVEPTVADEPTVAAKPAPRQSKRRPVVAQAAAKVTPEATPAKPPTRRGRQAAAPSPADLTAPSDAEQASAAVLPDEAPRTTRLGRGRKGSGEAPAPVHTSDDVQPGAADEAPVQRGGGHEVSPEARELIIAQLRKLGRPVHVRDFERTFTRQGREKLGVRRDLAGLLEDLAYSGDVIRTRRHTYGLPEAMNLVRGRFQASSGGFGFVIPDSGGDDFYIREGETLEAWNGDIVLIRPEGQSGGNDRFNERGNERGSERAGSRGGNRRSDSPRAAVVRIVTRAYSQLVGSLDHQKTYAFLKPDDHRARHRIMLQPDGTEGLPGGARVVAQLFWPEHTGEDEVYGEIVRVLGNEDDPATETQAVIVKYGLRDEFPDDVLREAEAIPRRFPDSALKGRLDLRDYNIFTVDGSDAKDFDDAIHIQATPEGTFVVGIHIADVSHYVFPGTALDAEAYARATSVYLPGAVLPMLPEHLSNGVCSLVPDEDRLTMSAMLELSESGEVLSATFTPSVIRSKARLTYDEVQAYSEAVATLQGNARALEGDLHLLLKITAKLRQKRLREGSLDFKMREVKVDVGKDGHMQLIPLREETARGMIEDLMLLANKAVAHYLLEKNVPTLFRIHEEPTLARFHDVTGAIGRMGLAFPGGEPTPQAYQAVLKSVRGTPQESVVNTLLLRSMQQAKYAEENLGHFGLAFEEYLHFTSPIRRYPDLLVHRALRAALDGPVSDRVRGDLAAPLGEQGRHTSERERTAAEAERDLAKYYQAKWAQEHIGESFGGRVSGVIASGLFVALENGVEGRLHISNLDDDYYFYIEDASILKGRTSGRIYRIGETIEVTVGTVNPLARQIDFTQENTMDGNDNRPRARRREDRESQKREKLSSFLPPRPGEVDSEAAPAAQGQQQQLQRGGDSGDDQAASRREPRPEREGVRPAEPRASESRPNEPRSSERAPRRDGAAGTAQRSGGASSSSSSGGNFRRRVVTLDRPRNEHLRPVNVTVQRMYFGDWTIENMPPDEGQGGGSGGGAPRGSTFRGRSAQQSGAQQSGGQSGGRGGGARSGGDQNRRPQQAREGAQPARDQAQAGNTAVGAAADEARRRRRRRGRRGGNGQSGQS